MRSRTKPKALVAKIQDADTALPKPKHVRRYCCRSQRITKATCSSWRTEGLTDGRSEQPSRRLFGQCLMEHHFDVRLVRDALALRDGAGLLQVIDRDAKAHRDIH